MDPELIGLLTRWGLASVGVVSTAISVWNFREERGTSRGAGVWMGFAIYFWINYAFAVAADR